MDHSEAPAYVSYHPPASGGTARCGVVLCNAFGSQGMMLHGVYRRLAEELAKRDCAVVRFDYVGTGDAPGYPRDLDLGTAMPDAACAMARWMKDAVGAENVCLIGAHSGGLVALEAALRSEEVDAVAVWTDISTGRRFVRSAASFDALSDANPQGRRPSHWRDGDAEFMGFYLSGDSLDSFAKMRPLDRDGALRSALVVPVTPGASTAAIADPLARAGAQVSTPSDFSTDLGAVLEEERPGGDEFVDAVTCWIVDAFPEPRFLAPEVPEIGDTVVLESMAGTRVEERILRIGDDGGVFGILTTPVGADTDVEVGVVLVNGGANHRPGINRNYTEWARAWAADGVPCLRIDYRGLGDSEAPPGARERLLYRDEAKHDVRDAVSRLLAEVAPQRVVAIGLCAGAYQSFRCALEDDRISRVVLLNPLRFFGGDLSAAEPLHRPPPIGRLRRHVAQAFLARAASPGSRPSGPLAALASWIDPRAGELAATLDGLVDRGCRVDAVFDSMEPLLPTFHRAVEPTRRRLGASERFSFHLIDDSNHIFSPLVAQERLAAHLSGLIREEVNHGPASRRDGS